MACVLHASHRQEFPLLRDTVLQLFQTVQLNLGLRVTTLLHAMQ